MVYRADFRTARATQRDLVWKKRLALFLSLTALCTVLHLTERLFLDHPNRLTNSKVQYVSLTSLGPTKQMLAQLWGVGVRQVWLWEAPSPPPRPPVSVFAGSTIGSWWQCS